MVLNEGARANITVCDMMGRHLFQYDFNGLLRTQCIDAPEYVLKGM